MEMDSLKQEARVQAHSKFVKFWRKNGSSIGEHYKALIKHIFMMAFFEGMLEQNYQMGLFLEEQVNGND